MAIFAEIDNDNIVVRVLVTSDEKPGEGYYWLLDRFGGTWIKTCQDTRGGVHRLGGEPLRKNFAGVGFTYDEDRDAFIPPKPFESWVLNEATCLWDSPVPHPQDGKSYSWDEESLSWIEIVEEEAAE